MLCENVVPQNKVMKLGKKKGAIEILMVCLDYTYFFISNQPSDNKLQATFKAQFIFTKQQ